MYNNNIVVTYYIIKIIIVIYHYIIRRIIVSNSNEPEFEPILTPEPLLLYLLKIKLEKNYGYFK